MPPTRPLPALLALPSLALIALACAGGSPATNPAERDAADLADASGPLPRWPAEPLARIDLPGEEQPTDVALLADGSLVVTMRRLERPEGGYTRSVAAVRFRALDGGPGARADIEGGPDTDAWALAVPPDGMHVAVAFDDHVALVPLDGGETRALPLRETGGDRAAEFMGACRSPWELAWAGPSLAARCATGPPAVVLDPTTGARLLTLPRNDPDGSAISVRGLALSPDGGTLALVGVSDDYDTPSRPWLELRTLPDGAVRTRRALEHPYEAVAFAPDGARLAVSHPYFGAQLFDAAGTGLARHTYLPDDANRGGGDVRFSPDGARLYRVGRRLSVTVHDAGLGILGHLPAGSDEPEHPLPPPADWPRALATHAGHLALSPDGRLLATIDRSDFARDVRVWRLPAE